MTAVLFDPLTAAAGPGDPDGHYAALDMHPGSTTDELRRRFRALARDWHPDRNASSDASGRMIRLNEAAAVLLDDDRRAEYDERGKVPPIVLAALPSTRIRCSTIVGVHVTRVIEIHSSAEVTDIDVSALAGRGWKAEAFAGASVLVPVVLEITVDAGAVRVVSDSIEVSAGGASVTITIDVTVSPSPTRATGTSGRSTYAPPAPPPPSASAPSLPDDAGVLQRALAWQAVTRPWHRRLTWLAWFVLVMQVMVAPMLLGDPTWLASAPVWLQPLVEARSTVFVVLAIIAALLTRGFRRSRISIAVLAGLLLLPGAFAAVTVGAVFVLVALVIAILLLFMF